MQQGQWGMRLKGALLLMAALAAIGGVVGQTGHGGKSKTSTEKSKPPTVTQGKLSPPRFSFPKRQNGSQDIVWAKMGTLGDAVAISPDGQLLAAPIAAGLGPIGIFRVSDGSVTRVLSGQTTTRVNAVAFSPDGQFVASGAWDNTVKLWRVSDGSLVRTLTGHANSVNAVAFSPDSQLVASGSTDRTVKLWRVSDGNLERTITGHFGSVNAVAFSPDGQSLTSGANDATVRLWQVSDGNAIRTLTGHTTFVNSVAFSSNGQMIASGSNDQTVKLWQVSDGTLLRTLTGHTAQVLSVAFSPDGQFVASGSNDRTVKLWQVSDGSVVRTLIGHSTTVRSVAFTPDGQTLASGSQDSEVILWRVSDGNRLNTITGPAGVVDSVDFSPDGQILASAGSDRVIRLWRTSDGALLRTMTGHTFGINTVAFSPDGQTLASGAFDSTIKLWRVSDGTLLNTLTGHGDAVWSVDFSPDGQMVASGSQDRSIKLWRVFDGALLNTLTGHAHRVDSVVFSPDGQSLVSGSTDTTIKIWRLSDGAVMRTLTGHTGGLWSVAISPDGQTIASASSDTTVRLWRFSDGTLLNTLRGHTREVTDVAFSPDGAIVASTAGDSTARLWQVSNGSLLQTLSGLTRNTLAVAYSPDGQFVAVGWEALSLWRVGAVTNTPPSAPTLIAPADNATITTFPFNLQLSATDPNAQRLKFKIELLQSGNVVRTFDQMQDNTGWDKTSYSSGETAIFTVPGDVTPGAYQWRAQAFDGVEMGPVSATRSFNFVLQGPVLLAVSPNLVANTAPAQLRVTGLNFQSGLEVRLEKSGQPTIIGSAVILEGQNAVTTQFNLTGAATGKWDVVVRNPNNVTGRLAQALTVTLPTDLILEEISIDPLQNLADGQLVAAKVKLKNASNADAVGAIPVTFEAWGQTVTVQQFGGLAANSAVTLSAPLKAKAGSGGELRCSADPTNVIPESNDGNNVISLPLPVVPFPDLTVTDLQFEPKNPRSGDTVRLTAKVKNLGAKVVGNLFIAFQVGADTVAIEPFSGLDAGQEREVSAHFRAQPGSHVVKAKVDPQNLSAESDETNNEFTVNLPTISQPDLMAVELQMNPASPSGGSVVSLSLKVKNAGAGEQGGPFTVEFRVDSTSVGTSTFVNSLPPGQEVTVGGALFRAQPGQHTVTAVIDPQNQVGESNEQNNTAQQAFSLQPADLVVEDMRFEPQQIFAGAQVKVQATVKNRGDGGAGGFLVGLFDGNTFVTSKFVSSLASASGEIVTLFYTARSGATTLRVAADINKNVPESQEDNNEASVSLPTIAPPDLTVSDIAPDPAAFVQGETVTVRATVRNNGAAFSGRAVVTFKSGDVNLPPTSVTLTSTNPNAVAESQFVVPIASTAFVVDKVEVTVDPSNQIPESDEQNNTAMQTVGRRAEPPDLAVTKISVPSLGTVAVGTSVPVMVEVRNLAAPCKGKVVVSLSADGKPVGTGEVQFTGLADERREATISWAALAGNHFKFNAEITIGDAVASNNALEQTVSIQVFPVDFQVTAVEFTPTSGVKLNDEVKFKVTVKNNGPGDVLLPVSVFLEVSGKRTSEGKQFIKQLATGEEKVLDFTWVASEQARPRAVAIADSDSAIQETDETNNAVGVDLPFDVARVEEFGVSLKPSVGNGLSAVPTPVSVTTNFTVQVKSFITVPTIFDLSVEGLPSDWFSLSTNEVFLQAGEWKDVTLSVTPPANASLSEKSFQVKATRRGTSDSRTADGKAMVVAKTEISDLLPMDGQTLPSDTVVFTWRTPVSSSSEVFLKREGETNEQRFEGAAGEFHRVVVPGLTVGARYQFRTQSAANGSTSTSGLRTITVGGGVAFSQKEFNFSIQRDYLTTGAN